MMRSIVCVWALVIAVAGCADPYKKLENGMKQARQTANKTCHNEYPADPIAEAVCYRDQIKMIDQIEEDTLRAMDKVNQEYRQQQQVIEQNQKMQDMQFQIQDLQNQLDLDRAEHD